jgi:hypothetical protein
MSSSSGARENSDRIRHGNGLERSQFAAIRRGRRFHHAQSEDGSGLGAAVVIGSPWQTSDPVPPFDTSSCTSHCAQTYLFPISFANVLVLSREVS